ncbi:MAG: hypothetical protein GDA36_07945 [Rhodobacteraceae bacterium]|nr:hypothetical protein [Paracoccaceae bacterium]
MSFLSKLFGGAGAKSPAEANPVAHKDFDIYPEPISEPGGYRIAARIEKEVGGDRLTHSMIRADIYPNRDEAVNASVAKAKQCIDQSGNGIFD